MNKEVVYTWQDPVTDDEIVDVDDSHGDAPDRWFPRRRSAAFAASLARWNLRL